MRVKTSHPMRLGTDRTTCMNTYEYSSLDIAGWIAWVSLPASCQQVGVNSHWLVPTVPAQFWQTPCTRAARPVAYHVCPQGSAE